MRIVIDTNVLMAGLISNSIVRRLLVSGKAAFYLPEFALEEVEKYEGLLKDKAGFSNEDFLKLKGMLLESIIVVPKKLTDKHMKEALAIMENIGKKDSVFIACALAISADGIFSFDKDFLQQKSVRCFGVKDLV